MFSPEAQNQQIDSLREELDRLNAHFNATLKDAGILLDDLKNIDISTLPATVQAALSTAQAEAKRAGAARAAQNNTAQASTARPHGTARRGIVRM
ncbi:MAG: hypothetical protein PHN64_05100 [Desulfovibrionaceae bacterium]|nr:hypothetical protein [Desulfovibrionaceae bacterium]